MVRRVVITGLGIVCSIGNNKAEVLESLKRGQSGIEYHQEYADLGFRSQVHGPIRLNLEALIDRKFKRFMGDCTAYSYLAMNQAIEDAGLGEEHISHPQTGLIIGSGGSSTANMLLATDTLRAKGARKVGPTMVPRIMASGTSPTSRTAMPSAMVAPPTETGAPARRCAIAG